MNAKSENENFNQKKGRKETTINSRKSIEIESISHGWQRYTRRWSFQKTSSDEFETNEFNTQTIRTLYIIISNHSITKTINVKKICEVNQIEWKHFSDSVNYQYTQFNPIHWEKTERILRIVKNPIQNFPNATFVFKLSFLLFFTRKHICIYLMKNIRNEHILQMKRKHSKMNQKKLNESELTSLIYHCTHLLHTFLFVIDSSAPESGDEWSPRRFTSGTLGSIVNVASF